MKNLNFTSKGHNDFQNLGNKTLFIADHENVKKSAFDLLAAKLWLNESTILRNVYTFEGINLVEYQGLFVCKSSSFSHNFTAN